jgi:hypothetical protein
METVMHGAGFEEHEVAGGIVLTVAVHVVRGFSWEDGPAQGFLKNQDMLKDIPLAIGPGVIRLPYPHITQRRDPSPPAPMPA